MFNEIDLSLKLPREDYRNQYASLQKKLAKIQREAIELDIPVILLLEGWEAAGKGELINRIIRPLDPRHYNVHTTRKPTREERLRPFLWRFWNRLPAKGQMVIFDRSWYGSIMTEHVEKRGKKKAALQPLEHINEFEKQLRNDGTLIVKCFLHISKKEQKKRFKKLHANPATTWRITEYNWKDHRNYKHYVNAAENVISETDTSYAGWEVVAAEDRRYATIAVLNHVIAQLTKRIRSEKAARRRAATARSARKATRAVGKSPLDMVDLSPALEREEYDKRLKRYQGKLRNLEFQLYRRRLPVIIMYEGWDAAGKGGNIRRLTQRLDPRGFDVIPIAAPSPLEKKHHYLWRFWKEIPKDGHIAIFDRTWYGRVLVERVEAFAKEAEWRRAYGEINETEKQLTDAGAIVVKFWIHIDKAEQLRRFEERENTAHKRWKITDEDWRNRKKWPAYKAAVDEMLIRTNTDWAPWTILEGNSKLHARIKALKTVIDAIEARI
ncbi:MAG: polyphosphate:AMP phosphotransferase [Calditrichia bacterium]